MNSLIKYTNKVEVAVFVIYEFDNEFLNLYFISDFDEIHNIFHAL